MRNLPSPSSSSSSLRKQNHLPPPHRLPPLPPPPANPYCTKSGLKKGPWTPQEDCLLTNYINKEGEGGWRKLPNKAGLLRCGKSCRLRWMNYLRPSVKRGHIAADEEDLIIRLHRLLGNRWSLIAGRIPGRTDNEIKNYWNTHLSKKMISQGIDPRTHNPLDPNTNFINSSSPSHSSSTTNTIPFQSLQISPDHIITPNISSVIKLPEFTDLDRHESGQITSNNDDEDADMMINYCKDEEKEEDGEEDDDEDEDGNVLSFLNSLMDGDDDLISPANKFSFDQPFDLQHVSSDDHDQYFYTSPNSEFNEITEMFTF